MEPYIDTLCSFCGFSSDHAHICRIDGRTIDPNGECTNNCFYDEQFFFIKDEDARTRTLEAVRSRVI